jgi:hypothetical protein
MQGANSVSILTKSGSATVWAILFTNICVHPEYNVLNVDRVYIGSLSIWLYPQNNFSSPSTVARFFLVEKYTKRP